MDVVALLLAAGRSERMGTPKALLPWHGQPLLAHQLQHIQKSRVHECVVVLGAGAERLQPLVDRSIWPGWKSHAIHNPHHAEGKTTSVIAGLTALPAPPDGVLVMAVDQPADWRLLNTLIDAADRERDRGQACARSTVFLPVFRGRRGHPTLFSGSLFGELMGIGEESEGLKAVVRRSPARVKTIEWDDPSILVDLNTPFDITAPPPGPASPLSAGRRVVAS